MHPSILPLAPPPPPPRSIHASHILPTRVGRSLSGIMASRYLAWRERQGRLRAEPAEWLLQLAALLLVRPVLVSQESPLERRTWPGTTPSYELCCMTLAASLQRRPFFGVRLS